MALANTVRTYISLLTRSGSLIAWNGSRIQCHQYTRRSKTCSVCLCALGWVLSLSARSEATFQLSVKYAVLHHNRLRLCTAHLRYIWGTTRHFTCARRGNDIWLALYGISMQYTNIISVSVQRMSCHDIINDQWLRGGYVTIDAQPQYRARNLLTLWFAVFLLGNCPRLLMFYV